ncbi:MAG: hypothetical protein MUF16_18205 [Burkholderiaceae bacterium]|jgi:hypothetical protein|nr:hypothetical protein [Burkholderiaceae bacterium]
MKFTMTPPRLGDGLAGGAINGIINGAIAWSAFKSMPQVPLSVDSISAPGITALGNAATVVFALTFILATITFFTFRSAARKSGHAPRALTEQTYWPQGLGIALRNTLLAFGSFVVLAVLWQRFAGTLLVGPLAATVVVGLVAMGATMFAEWRTRGEMLQAAAAAAPR